MGLSLLFTVLLLFTVGLSTGISQDFFVERELSVHVGQGLFQGPQALGDGSDTITSLPSEAEEAESMGTCAVY